MDIKEMVEEVPKEKFFTLEMNRLLKSSVLRKLCYGGECFIDREELDMFDSVIRNLFPRVELNLANRREFAYALTAREIGKY